MRPTSFRLLAGRSMTLAAMLAVVSTSLAQNDRVQAGVQTPGSAVAQGRGPKDDGVVVLGGALPGGAVLSSAVSSLTAVKGGGAAAASYAATGRAAPVTCPLTEDGTFEFKGLKPGKYELRISFPSGPRQTTSTDSTVTSGKEDAQQRTKHDTVKNSIGNIRAREQGQAGGVNVAVGDVNGDGKADAAAAGTADKIDPNSMPNRISMNVTIAKRVVAIEADGDPIIVEIGADGVLKGRAALNAAHSNPL